MESNPKSPALELHKDGAPGTEAQSSNFRITKIEHQSMGGFKFLVTAKVEESDVADNVKRTYDLIQERGKWRIDAWDDPVVSDKEAD